MSVKKLILEVGLDKDGAADFGVSGNTMGLSYEQMEKVRAMIPVAIAQFENMWYRAKVREQKAAQENGATK